MKTDKIKTCGDFGGKAKVTGNPCEKEAGWGTDHVGEGKCRLHGGSLVGNQHALKHGRYAKINSKRIKSLLAEQENEANPLDLLPDLYLARANLIDYMERLEENNEAVLRWHASFQENYRKAFETWRREVSKIKASDAIQDDFKLKEPPDPILFVDKPRKLMDISDAIRWIAEITKIVERIESIDLSKRIHKDVFDEVTKAMGRDVAYVLEKYVDRDRLNAAKLTLEQRWGGISISGDRWTQKRRDKDLN